MKKIILFFLVLVVSCSEKQATRTLVKHTYRPHRIEGLPNGITEIAAGFESTCAIANGDVYCWGGNTYGELGQGTIDKIPHSPTKVSQLPSNVHSLVTDGASYCVVQSGKGFCWGRGDALSNSAGKSVCANSIDSCRAYPMAVVDSKGGELDGISRIVMGEGSACALRRGNDTFCWGRYKSYFYALARSGASFDYARATESFPKDLSSLALGAGWCMASDDGDLVSCANTTYKPTVSGVDQLYAGGHHFCATLNAGGVSCWGASAYGQLGDGIAREKDHATEVFTGREKFGQGALKLALGGYHTCAASKEQAWCWGKNDEGQLGRPFTEKDKSSIGPITARELSSITDISAGTYHTCAVQNNVAVYCWGSNREHQLGGEVFETL